MRDELENEALRLGRILAALVPEEPEVHGLIALIEFQASRFGARTDRDGRPIPLDSQYRSSWNGAQISRGIAALAAADGAAGDRGRGPYALQVVDDLAKAGQLAGSHLLPSVRGELLSRLNRHTEAAVEFDTAAAMTGNDREREMLSEKAAAARSQS